MSEEIISRQEVCKLLALNPSTVDYFVRTQQIPFLRLGARSIRFAKDEVMQWALSKKNVAYHRPTKKGGDQE